MSALNTLKKGTVGLLNGVGCSLLFAALLLVAFYAIVPLLIGGGNHGLDGLIQLFAWATAAIGVAGIASIYFIVRNIKKNINIPDDDLAYTRT